MGLSRLALGVATVGVASASAAVWPLPATASFGTSTLWIDPSVAIAYNAPSTSCTFRITDASKVESSNANSSAIVQTAVSSTYTTLFNQSFVPWKFHPRNSDFEPASGSHAAKIQSITLQQNKSDITTVLKPIDGAVDESYDLAMTSDGHVTITASSSIGLAHGLTTFTQFFYKHSKGGVYTPYAPAHVSDKPMFAHRGLNMDVSRNFYPVATIKRTIDGLAYSKMNRLHLHITDAQSWPLEVPSIPELAEKGRYSPGLTYSPSDLAGLQQYGAVRGVEVFIEIDMPGHTSSIWYSHPELVAAFNVQPGWDNVAAEPPSGTLKLNSSAVYSFLDKLFDDVLPRVYPYTSYFHAGADEVNFNAYKYDDTVGTNSSDVIRPLLQKFIDFAHDHVRKAGLVPIAWEETLLSYNLTLGSDVIVQAWQSSDSAKAIVEKGHKALVGDYTYWYLDCGKGQWLNFEPGSASAAHWPYLDYCAPYHNWRDVYSYDPLSGIPADLTHLVQGGEAHIWSEQTDPTTVDFMIWPRAAAAAEILWSGAKDASGQNRSQIAAAPRLAEMRERLVARGIQSDSIQMPFCTQNNGSQINQCGFWNSFGQG